MSDSQKQRIHDCVPSETEIGLELTPAQVEQMTIEHESIEAMISALEKRAEIFPDDN